ncbi:hypothetical protein HDU67_006693 [Dinochytrium kinnereticum]|nr:hypothetical protein HDU67_006693 [Dinochytrium kinnereticum]
MVQLYLKYRNSAVFGVVSSQASNLLFADDKGRRLILPCLEDLALWDVRTGEKLASWRDEDNLKAEVSCLVKSADSRHLAVGYTDGTVRLWSLANQTLTATFSGHKTSVTSLAFDRLGERLASGSKDTDIVIWDVLTETGLHRLRGHRDQITGIRFLEANAGVHGRCDHLVSTSKDTLMKFWDLKTVCCVETVVAHRGEAWALEILPYLPSASAVKRIMDDVDQDDDDARQKHPPSFTLVTGGIEGDVKVWSVDAAVLASKLEASAGVSEPKAGMEVDGEEEEEEMVDPSLRKAVKLRGAIEKQHKERIVTIVAHPSGKYLGVQSNDRYVELYKIRSESDLRKRLQRLKKRHREKRKSKTQLDPASLPTITLQDLIPRYGAIRCSAKIRSFDLSTAFTKPSTTTTRQDASFHVACGLVNNQVEVHLANPSASSSTEDAEEEEGAASRHEVTIETPGHRSDVRTICLSSDDAQVLTASSDAVKLWAVDTNQCITTITPPDNHFALCSSFVPGNLHAIVGTKEGFIDLYDLASSSVLTSVKAHEGPIWSLQVWPDRRGVTTGSADKEVKFWEFALTDTTPKKLTLTHTRTLRLTDDVLSLRHSHDSQLLAVSLLDSTVKVFYADTLKFFLSLYGHTLPVLAMDVSSDSQLIATGSADKSFEQIQKLEGHHSEVWSLAISKYGKKILTTSHDRSIRIFTKTDDQFTLEEERERDLEAIHDTDEVLQDRHDLPIGSLATLDDPLIARSGDAAGVPAAQRATEENVRAADRVLAALEIWEEEGEADKVFAGEVERAVSAGVKVPKRGPRNPYVVAALGKRSEEVENVPELYVLSVFEGVRSVDIERVVVGLGFLKVLQILEVLVVWARKSQFPDHAYQISTWNPIPYAGLPDSGIGPSALASMKTSAPPRRSPITTHVLDTTIGMPAVGVEVALHILEAAPTPLGASWNVITVSRTDADGRCGDLIPVVEGVRAGLVAGAVYKLTFGIEEYFKRMNKEAFFPVAEIQFRVSNPAAPHYHIPLLLSGYSYSTYRGS